MGLKLTDPLPDETTILNFRHLLERHELGRSLLDEINTHLESQGLRLREGTIMDATVIEAPSSTRNRAGERDPEMHQTKKGNQWHFGMKAHIGVDSDTGIVHSLSTTADNVHDVTEAHNLLHGGETRVWGDAGYQGVHQREENLGRGVEWQVAMRPGKRRKLDPESPEAMTEKRKASMRAKVEHPFLKVKRIFGYAKVRYWGLAKNTDPAVWPGQPADGGGTTGKLTWAQWVQTGAGCRRQGRSNPQRPRRSGNGGRTLGKAAPKTGNFREISPVTARKGAAVLIQSFLRSPGKERLYPAAASPPQRVRGQHQGHQTSGAIPLGVPRGVGYYSVGS